MARTAIAPALKFLAGYLLVFALIAWVDHLYTNLLIGVGGRLENLPLATQGPLVLARWMVQRWPLLLLVALVLAGVYGLAVTPPEGKRPRPWLVLLLWCPLAFFYALLVWMAVAQRQPIGTLQNVVGAGGGIDASITEKPATGTPPSPAPEAQPDDKPPASGGEDAVAVDGE